MLLNLICAIGLTIVQLTAYGSGVNPRKYQPDLSYTKTPIEAALYKYIIPRPLERTTNIHDLKIVVPDDPKWRELGNMVSIMIKSRWGINPEITIPDSNKFSSGWSGNTLILGNLGNNTQMARLYGLRMSYADAIYPGKGGYTLLTLIDPFGLGGNTIIIGASDLNGAGAGVNELIAILSKEKSPTIPWLFKSRLSEETNAYFDKNENFLLKAKQTLKNLKPIKDDETVATSLVEVLSQIKLYGEYYQLTGNPIFGEIYGVLLKEYTMFVNQFPQEAINQLGSSRNMWIQGEKLFQQWSVLEADSLFTQLNRSQILSALYLTCEANANDGYLLSAPKTGSRWNHEIFPAVSLSGSCNYFEKYYSMPEIIKWKQRGDQIFKGNTSYISLDEGSDYLVHVPMINIDYGMASGNLKYISQSLRPSADLNAMMIDNLGTMSGGGDTYPFGMSSAYSWGHSQVMNAATWYYNDPIYDFLLNRTRTGPFPGQKMPDLDYPIHRYMVSTNPNQNLISSRYPKVQAQQIEPGVYNELKQKEHLDIEQSQTFHKLTFRSGFTNDDNYLILDGFSAGRHGHQDGNAILNYNANGRLFLNDRDYIQNTPEYHTGVVIVKDGEQPKKPLIAKLKWVADLDGTSISRSQMPDYNGTDWDRTIISPDGKFYIIYDDLKINKPGNFLFKNLWQSLGTPAIQHNIFSVDQKGVTMLLQSMKDSDLQLKDVYGHFIKYWKTVYPYPYADKETVLTEIIHEKKYTAGDQIGFANILSSYKDGHRAINGKRINSKTISITDGDTKWLAIQGSINMDGFSSNGSFNLLGNNELVIASVSKIKIGESEHQFPYPVFFKMNLSNGKWKSYDLLKDRITYNDKGDPERKTSIDSGIIAWKSSFERNFEQLGQTKHNKPQAPQHSPHNKSSVKGWTQIYKFNEQVTSSVSGDLNNDGIDEFLLGGINGTVKAVNNQGQTLWTFKAKGRINEITIQQADNQNYIFIATENWYVQVLNTAGQELWNKKLPDDDSHKEYKGNLIGVTHIRIAYPYGKFREPSVMVGTQFRYLYELDLKGNVKDDTMLYFYGIDAMEYADMDGDGKEEGMFGLEYYYYTLIKDKKLLTGKTGGPGWKVIDVLNKNDKTRNPSMLLGSKQSEIRMIQYKDKIQELWVKNVGGEVNDIRHGDFNNDGHTEILAATEGFQLYVLNEDGTTIFRKTLNERVLKVDGFRKNGQAHYYAATAGGWLFKFSEHGNAEKSVQFPLGIVNILNRNNRTTPWIVLENGYVYKME